MRLGESESSADDSGGGGGGIGAAAVGLAQRVCARCYTEVCTGVAQATNPTHASPSTAGSPLGGAAAAALRPLSAWQALLRDRPELAKYERMSGMGVPLSAVVHKMILDQLSDEIVQVV